MQKQTANNKRIVRNTFLLYFRMIVTTAVSLFTARLMLQLLGIEDYGINNVVGGIIGFMSIITSTMTSATTRFLAYDLGKNDIKQYRQTFSMLINIFAIFCFISIIILEFVGPYFIQEYLVIPNTRLYAAQWIFQFSIITFIISTMAIPFTASIVSYERMDIYAYFAFIDVFFKLLAVVALYLTPIDKLITYGLITLLMSVASNAILFVFCVKKLNGCKYYKYWDKQLFYKISSYAGWNMFGSTTTVMNGQGQAILLNMFFGPAINAAKAIADKVNQIIYSFCQNFFMSVNPQIIKTYANGELEYTKKLIIKSSKFGFFLYMIIALPLIFNMEFILTLWLGAEQVTNNMVYFCQLILSMSFTSSLESPITQAVRATGNIKKYQIVIGLQTLSFIPICYMAFKLGAEAFVSMVILCIIYCITLISRIFFIIRILPIKIKEYLYQIVSPATITLVLSSFIFVVIDNISKLKEIFYLKIPIELIVELSIISYLGLSTKERTYLWNILKTKCNLNKQTKQ